MQPNDASNVTLRAVGMSATHGIITVIRGVNLDVNAGEIVALLGPNGAGKTSLVEAMAGRVKSSGELTLKGKRIDNIPSYRRVRAGLSLIPDTRGLFRTMTVADNLALGHRLAPRSKRSVLLEESLDLFPALRDRLGQEVGLMSGGEQQMVAIAKALVSNPVALILDEPTQGLAPHVLEDLALVLQRLKSAGLAIILVEQNYSFARSLADRATVLSSGEVVRELEKTDIAGDDDIIRAYLGT